MNISKVIFTFVALCALAGCQNPYQKFYQSTLPPVITIGYLPAESQRVAPMDGDARHVQNEMWEQGYGLIGISHFNGPAQDQSKALAQAHDVGAEVVLVSSKFQNTVTGSIPITTPTTQTSFTNGTATAYGTGGYATGSYNGTTTTYGTQTNYIPYSVDRYEQGAMYFARIERKGFGILVYNPTDAQKQIAGTNQLMVVAAVRHGSPAFLADLLPGDLILSVGGAQVYDLASLRTATERGQVAPVDIVFIRGGTKQSKTVSIPATW